MSKKIIFFDVDGTLVDVRPAREYIPESTIKAVRETRAKGKLCFPDGINRCVSFLIPKWHSTSKS